MDTIQALPLPPQSSDSVLRQLRGWLGTGAPGLVLWLGIHAPLGIMLHRMPLLAGVHALFVLVIGVWIALRGAPHHVLSIAAYIVGSEVLWRMAKAPLPWEFGKYTVILLLGVTLLRAGPKLRIPILPLVYIVLLLPSLASTIAFFDSDLNAVRRNALGNLSGPFSLMLSVWFCSVFAVDRRQLWRSMMTGIGPLLGAAAVTAFTTYSAEAIQFSGESNFVTSGGFGPNQVSSMLGLGLLLAFLLLVNGGFTTAVKLILFLTMVILGMQSAMTFSRGGLYGAAGSAILGTLFLLRDTRAVLRLLTAAALLWIVATFVVFPRLDAFTGGALSARFTNTESTGRTTLMMIDFELWKQNPVFGLGPGVSKFSREGLGYREAAAHTEQTRLLAEHGTLGLFALLTLGAMAWRCVRHAATPANRAMAVSLLAWSMLYMLHAAMRLSAAGFIFGLAFAACRTVNPGAVDRRRLRAASCDTTGLTPDRSGWE